MLLLKIKNELHAENIVLIFLVFLAIFRIGDLYEHTSSHIGDFSILYFMWRIYRRDRIKDVDVYCVLEQDTLEVKVTNLGIPLHEVSCHLVRQYSEPGIASLIDWDKDCEQEEIRRAYRKRGIKHRLACPLRSRITASHSELKIKGHSNKINCSTSLECHSLITFVLDHSLVPIESVEKCYFEIKSAGKVVKTYDPNIQKNKPLTQFLVKYKTKSNY